jgi:serine/threonine-protein kinase
VNPNQFLHYQLAERLGEGPLGETWQAVDPALERGVVIKLLRPFAYADEDTRSRFVLQCEQLHATAYPPAAVFDWTVDGERQAIVRELTDGRSLEEIRRGKPIQYLTALALLEQLARAVKTFHDAGMLHGNLHPRNVILGERGKPYLTDILVPVALTPWHDALPPTYRIFVSPEIISGRTPDILSDIYSLGAISLYLFAGDSMLNPTETSGPLCDRPELDALPAEGQLLFQKMLSSDPSDRFRDIDELIATVNAVRLDLPSALPGRPRRPSPRTYLSLSILTILLIIFWIVLASIKK